jgi:hypothetical protein
LYPDNELGNFSDKIVADIPWSGVVSGVKMGWVGVGLFTGLDLIKVFEFFEAVFINGTDGFGEIAVHLATADVKVGVIVVDDPGENGVLGQVVVGSVGCNVDKV